MVGSSCCCTLSGRLLQMQDRLQIAIALSCWVPQQRIHELAAKHMQSKLAVPVLYVVWAASTDTKCQPQQEGPSLQQVCCSPHRPAVLTHAWAAQTVRWSAGRLQNGCPRAGAQVSSSHAPLHFAPAASRSLLQGIEMYCETARHPVHGPCSGSRGLEKFRRGTTAQTQPLGIAPHPSKESLAWCHIGVPETHNSKPVSLTGAAS